MESNEGDPKEPRKTVKLGIKIDFNQSTTPSHSKVPTTDLESLMLSDFAAFILKASYRSFLCQWCGRHLTL